VSSLAGSALLPRMLAGCLSPAGRRARLSVLIFHRVLPRSDPLFPGAMDAGGFDRMLSWLTSQFNVLPLGDAVARLQAGNLPARAASITFDDGYADNATLALPALLRHRVQATFFVASGYLDGGRMWNDTVIESIRGFKGAVLDLNDLSLGTHPIAADADRRRAIDHVLKHIKHLAPASRQSAADQLATICRATLPDDLMMTSQQVRVLRDAGMTIGGHTFSHPILNALGDAEALDDIVKGKRHLESILGERVELFAYPNGKPGSDYSARHADMVRQAGFTAAVSTSPGAARSDTDLFQLPRFTPWDRTPMRFGLRMADNLRSAGQVAA
jgi:peptidoglycan/xylan/chitin deacetylase (PgdA/CDA1 family)